MQCIHCFQCLVHAVYTEKIPPSKRINQIEKTRRGGIENRGFNGKSNYKVEFFLKAQCFLLVCAVIVHLALCRKHDLKMPFLG